MVSTQNKKIVERISDDAKIQQLEVPTQINKSIQPVLISNPQHIIKTDDAVKTTTGTSTLFTTDSNRDTYITGFYFGYVKDNACDIASGQIDLLYTPHNESTVRLLCRLPVLTLTTQQDSAFLTLKHPVKVKRGTNVQINGTYAAGNMVRCATVYYYETDEM